MHEDHSLAAVFLNYVRVGSFGRGRNIFRRGGVRGLNAAGEWSSAIMQFMLFFCVDGHQKFVSKARSE